MTAAPTLPMAMPRRRPPLEVWLVTDSRGRRQYWIEARDAAQAGAYLQPGEHLIPPGAPACNAAARRRPPA